MDILYRHINDIFENFILSFYYEQDYFWRTQYYVKVPMKTPGNITAAKRPIIFESALPLSANTFLNFSELENLKVTALSVVSECPNDPLKNI